MCSSQTGQHEGLDEAIGPVGVPVYRPVRGAGAAARPADQAQGAQEVVLGLRLDLVADHDESGAVRVPIVDQCATRARPSAPDSGPRRRCGRTASVVRGRVHDQQERAPDVGRRHAGLRGQLAPQGAPERRCRRISRSGRARARGRAPSRAATSWEATLSVERQNSQPTPATKVTSRRAPGPGTSGERERGHRDQALPAANTRSALRCSRTRGITAAVATAPRPWRRTDGRALRNPNRGTWLAYTGSSDIRPAPATPNANERTSTPRRMCENMA